MRLTLSRRILSYIVDAIPIILIVIGIHSLFVGGILKNQIEDYDTLSEQYDVLYEQYQLDTQSLYDDFDNGLISQEVLEDDIISVYETFIQSPEYRAVSAYLILNMLYGVITYMALYYAYVLIFKGNTFGRKLVGAQLSGSVKWYTLFIREVMWKHFFWLLFIMLGFFLSTFMYIPMWLVGTLAILGIFIDIIMIGFSGKKKAIRDYLSNTEVTYKGVNYPF